MGPMNAFIQSTAIDLLQAIVARGEMDVLALESVEAAVISKLYYCVHMKRLELQNKLLHLLHSIISAIADFDQSQMSRQNKAVTTDSLPERSILNDGQLDPEVRALSVNPLLTQTLMDGIAIPTNRPVLQHWLDFILMTAPQFQQAMHAVVSPLSDCVCRQLRIALTDIQRVSASPSGGGDIISTATDAEFTMFLNALERLVLLSLSVADAIHTEDDSVLPDKPSGTESGGLLGIMTNVFASETAPIGPVEQLTVRIPSFRSLV
jgi:hypothetical protein